MIVADLWPASATSEEWAHTGIAVLPDDRLVVGAPEGGALVFLAPEGGEVGRVASPLLEHHGISLAGDAVWVADPGGKARPRLDYDEEVRPGRAALLGLDGQLERELRAPYPGWKPTSVVAWAGLTWVADGYGRSRVHAFDAAGSLVHDVGGTTFDCPHGLIPWNDGLVVADRGNRRLVVLDSAGTVVREISDRVITSPSCLAVRGAELLVTELFGGLLAVDARGAVRAITPAPSERDEPWPNARDTGGRLVRPALEPERLHSPHGIAIGAGGEIYLTEWLIGGRVTRRS